MKYYKIHKIHEYRSRNRTNTTDNYKTSTKFTLQKQNKNIRVRPSHRPSQTSYGPALCRTVRTGISFHLSSSRHEHGGNTTNCAVSALSIGSLQEPTQHFDVDDFGTDVANMFATNFAIRQDSNFGWENSSSEHAGDIGLFLATSNQHASNKPITSCVLQLWLGLVYQKIQRRVLEKATSSSCDCLRLVSSVVSCQFSNPNSNHRKLLQSEFIKKNRTLSFWQVVGVII